MPGLDGTGPLGLGPRTGRGLGLCPPGPPAYPRSWGYYPHGWPLFGVGRGGLPWGGGRGRTWGGGRGGWWRGWFWRGAYSPGYFNPFFPPLPGPENEKEWLKEEAASLEKELKEIRARLEELERAKGE